MPRSRFRLGHTIEPTFVRWVWKNYLPRGKLTVVAGEGGIGKSTGLLDIGARVTTGHPFPDEDDGVGHEPAGVVYVGAEDDAADTILPRFTACGGIEERLAVLDPEAALVIPRDVRDLEAIGHEIGARMVIVDPVNSFIAGTDGNSDVSVRAALGPLVGLAQRLDAAVVVVLHVGKARGQRAKSAALGSVAYVNLSRTTLLFAADPDVPGGFCLGIAKSNLAPPQPVLRGSVVEVGTATAVRWTGISPRTVDELMDVDQLAGDMVDADELEAEVLAAIDGGATKTAQLIRQVRDETGAGERRVRDALADLRKRGVIEQLRPARGQGPARWERLS